MPVPDVKELAAQLEIHLFLNSKVLDDGYVVIVVTETPIVRNARALAKVEVEVVVILESVLVEQWLVRFEVALGLRPDARPGEDAGDARCRELTRHVAVAGAEEEWDAGTSAKDRGQSPPTDEPIQYPAGVRRPAFPAAQGEIVNEGFGQGLGYIWAWATLLTMPFPDGTYIPLFFAHGSPLRR